MLDYLSRSKHELTIVMMQDLRVLAPIKDKQKAAFLVGDSIRLTTCCHLLRFAPHAGYWNELTLFKLRQLIATEHFPNEA